MSKKIKSLFSSFFIDRKAQTDIVFLCLLFLLIGIGLICLWSASYPVALNEGTPSYSIVLEQAKFALLGIALMFGISYFDYEKLKQKGFPFFSFAFTIVLLIIPLLGPGDKNGIKRWIYIGGKQFQPSELAKFGLILLFAYLIDRYYVKLRKLGSWKGIAKNLGLVVLIFGVPLGIVALLLIKEPHLSCTVLVAVITIAMMFVGGVRKRWLAIILIVGVVGFLIISKTGYFSERMEVWRDPFNADKDDSWQIIQSLYAIGSGGFLGVGFGNSRQKYLYLPEPENDFIFSVICEELGFLGALFIIVLFVLFVYKGLLIAIRAKDKFGSLLAFGTIVQIGVQALLNMAVVSGTAPNTGISLPFFSAGGTSLIMLLMQVGVVLSVARKSSVKKL